MHNTYWDTFMWLFSDKYVWIPLYVSLAFLIFKNYDPKVFLYCLLTVLVMIVFTDGVSSHILRPYIGRLRPSNLDNPISDVVHIVDGHRGGKFSFPSSHSANSWGLVFFIIYFWTSAAGRCATALYPVVHRDDNDCCDCLGFYCV